MGVQPEGVEGASGKPPPRLRRGETLCNIKGTTAQFVGSAGDAFSAICFLQKSRFTSSKPSISAIASDKKCIRHRTNSFVRYCLKQMRKLFALILILGVLACALGFYAADTFETSDYYRVLNPVFRTAVGHDIDPDTVKDMMAIHVDGNLPGVGEFNFSLNALIDGDVDLPGLGHVSLSDLLGKELNFGQRLQAKAVIAGYGWSHELKLYGGIAAGVMAFLLIGTHRPKRRR